MTIQRTNNKGEAILSLSNWQTRRRKVNGAKLPPPILCECSTCGEKATVQPETPHQFCRGLKLTEMQKARLPTLCNPKRKGTWKKFIPAPKVADAPAEASTVVSEAPKMEEAAQPAP